MKRLLLLCLLVLLIPVRGYSQQKETISAKEVLDRMVPSICLVTATWIRAG